MQLYSKKDIYKASFQHKHIFKKDWISDSSHWSWVSHIAYHFQGVWAYKYWEMEKNTKEAMVKLAEVITEAIKQEFQDIVDKLNAFQNTKVRVKFNSMGWEKQQIQLTLSIQILQRRPEYNLVYQPCHWLKSVFW